MNVFPLAYPVRLLAVVLADLALYVVGTNFHWLFRVPRPGRLGQAVDLTRQWARKLRLGELLRLTYYLLVPYFVLYWGWASPLDFGLADLDWMAGISATAALGGGTLLLLIWLWWQHSRLVEGSLRMQQTQWLQQPWGWVLVLCEVLFLEAWWALCRSPMLLLAGPYWGVYWGLFAVWVAALLNPRLWHELRTPGYREGVLLTWMLATVTATLYVFVHNLWLCVALHAALRMTILELVRRQSRNASCGGQHVAS